MKRILSVLLIVTFLAACADTSSEEGRAMELRQRLHSGEGCMFLAEITADYGESVYLFSVECKTDRQGDMTFTVLAPETISGISGRITDSGGELTFDDQVLAFETVADDLLSPICAPWLLLRGLRSGYFSAYGYDEGNLLVHIDDSYQDKALRLEGWVNPENQPVISHISWAGNRILSMKIESFSIL